MGGADEPRLGRGLGGERAVFVFESVVSAGRDGGGGGVLRDQRLGDFVTRVESHALEADHGRARLDPAVGQWHALLVGLLHADLVPPALVIADRQPPTGYGLDGAGEREPLCDGELG